MLTIEKDLNTIVIYSKKENSSNHTTNVNMVAEPKPHQTGRKRQNMTKTGNDCYCASTAFPPRLAPPLKRPRLMPPARSQQQQQQQPQQQQQQQQQQQPKQQKVTSNAMQDLSQLKVYSNPDILICGNCREMFTELGELLEHKRDYCKLRFTCKCHTFNGATPTGNSAASLLCVLCKDSFPSAWELMVHAQAAHMINIYELGTKAEAKYSRSPRENNKESSQSPTPQDQQEGKGGSEASERAEEEELDGHVLLPSPDSGKSTDNENALSPIKIRSEVNGSDHEDCDELMVVENRSSSGQACFTRRPIAIVSVFDCISSFRKKQYASLSRQAESTLELNASTNNSLSSGAESAVQLTPLTNGSISAKE
ncbi:hypothetical protein TSAR_012676 [Trichomalopsis sarcophagae]|uniref:C2H2-type domain-containing protein n=1 Tax=Trichomalopsis sarcophagae TaxID=543379 RepID=A0A232FCP9_9HYME|nr:hypothetical protein TSAR_012676 [Trichomalopsis sarcophagae]